MSTPQNTAPDFGEPWKDREWLGLADCEDRNGTPVICDFHFIHDDPRKRIVACVNACAGLADPAVEIAAMRAAIKETSSHLSGFLGFHSDALTTTQMRSISDCLAKLTPFLP